MPLWACVCLFVCVFTQYVAYTNETRLLGEILNILHIIILHLFSIYTKLASNQVSFQPTVMFLRLSDHTVLPVTVQNVTNSLWYSHENWSIYFCFCFCFNQSLDLFILDTGMHSYSNDLSFHPTALPSRRCIPCAGSLSYKCKSLF